jgi:hypothetical protein
MEMSMRAGRFILGGLTAAAGACALGVLTYPTWRSWCLFWGASEPDARRVLPGDELLEEPDLVTTRAIGIEATASSVWPWLV